MITWTDALGRYVTAMQAAGRSPGTVRLHRHYLRRLAEQQRGGPWSVSTCGLQRFLSPPAWAPETRKSARAAVRGFYRWAHGMGLVEEDPADRLQAVRVPPGRPRPTPEHLVAQLTRGSDRLGFMGMLAAHAGLRAAEIARVNRRDLLGDELLVHGKGGKVRAVPVVVPALLARLSRIEDPEGWAFPNGRGSHLSPGHVTRLLSDALPDGWTAHTLRHRCGTTAYAATRDLLAVGALLGHSRPETTQRYVLLPNDALRAAALGAA